MSLHKPVLIIIAENKTAKILFRLTEGKLARQYVEKIPEWAQTILSL